MQFKNRELFSNVLLRPGYIEHSREMEIASIWWGFVIFERSLKQIRSKGNEKPFNIVGIGYIPCSM